MTGLTDLSGALTADEADRIAQLAELLETRGVDFIELCRGDTTVLVARRPGSRRPPSISSAVPATTVASPAVGVFQPAVQAMATVADGGILGHVHKLDEAVTVTAPEAGRIGELCVPAGSFVEYGQALLRMHAA